MASKEAVIALAVFAIVAASAVVLITNEIHNPGSDDVYNITYVLNDGTNSPDNPTTYTHGKKVDLKDPTREGFVFIGWFTDENLENEISAISKTTRGDLTLYAGWEKSEIGIYMTFSLKGSVTETTGLLKSVTTLDGTTTFSYVDYKKDKGYLMLRNETLTMTKGLNSVTRTDYDSYWTAELDSEWTMGERKTIDTPFGEKECQIWICSEEDSTETQYIGDDDVVYYIEYIGETTSGLSKTTTSITYTLTETGTSNSVERTFEWTYDHNDYVITLDISYSDFLRYANDTVAVRHQVDNKHDSIYFTVNDPYIAQIAEELETFSQGHSSLWKAGLALAFVQQCIEYDQTEVDDDVEYWRYPLETLFESKGDCEDTSFLFATIAMKMGYDCCTIIFNDHMTAGVVVEGCDGYYYETKNKHYYYCETTSDSWDIGDQPVDKYKQEHVKRYVFPQ